MLYLLTELSLLFSLILISVDWGRAFDKISARFVPLSPVSLETPSSSKKNQCQKLHFLWHLKYILKV